MHNDQGHSAGLEHKHSDNDKSSNAHARIFNNARTHSTSGQPSPSRVRSPAERALEDMIVSKMLGMPFQLNPPYIVPDLEPPRMEIEQGNPIAPEDSENEDFSGVGWMPPTPEEMKEFPFWNWQVTTGTEGAHVMVWELLNKEEKQKIYALRRKEKLQRLKADTEAKKKVSPRKASRKQGVQKSRGRPRKGADSSAGPSSTKASRS